MKRIRFPKRVLILALIALLALMALAACAKTRQPRPPWGQETFAQYASQTRNFVSFRRKILGDRPLEEIAWNSPAEWRPKGKSRKGVLLIHGLGDSPFSFVDLGPALAEMGIVARAILLPGCGTRPEDLMGIKLNDWRRTVAEHVALLAREVDEVYLGGFSTGANLALDYALAVPGIEGLVLFSPALKSNSPFAFLAPLAASLMDWVVKPPKNPEGLSLVRYDMVPADAFALWWESTKILNPPKPYPKPALVILAEKDSVVDVSAVAADFDARFPHPSSRLVWYGEHRASLPERTLIKPASVPEFRVDNFSHMGALFSPENPEYGPSGAQRMCRNGQERDLFQKCLSDPEVRYSAYGEALPGTIAARLTFNPWFDWQAGVLASVWGL